MSDLLVRRELLPTKSHHRAMDGGWALGDPALDPALGLGTPADESLVKAVPHPEFLVDSGVSLGPLVQRFKRLRFLGVATWDGELDLQDLPDLECGILMGSPFATLKGARY